jgi:hypothetical protein
MYARLGEDEEEELLAGEIYGTSPHAPDPDYESEAYYEHEEMLARQLQNMLGRESGASTRQKGHAQT